MLLPASVEMKFSSVYLFIYYTLRAEAFQGVGAGTRHSTKWSMRLKHINITALVLPSITKDPGSHVVAWKITHGRDARGKSVSFRRSFWYEGTVRELFLHVDRLTLQ